MMTVGGVIGIARSVLEREVDQERSHEWTVSDAVQTGKE